MATTVERLGIVETKVTNLDEKLDDLKVDVRDMHDCLDKTRDGLTAQLEKMYDASCSQHTTMATEIKELKGQRDKFTYMIAGGIAAMGILSGHFESILKILVH